MQTTRRTPAKVNLSLLVGPADEDGFHRLFTVFVPVDVFDDIEFALEARPARGVRGAVRVECRVATGEANLAAQALRALERHTGWAFDGRVVIRKGIPAAAGLGGGSSDAACSLLVGVETLAEAGGPIPAKAELVGLARDLGADVAFFLDPTPSVGRGRGELLEPTALPVLSLVLVFFDGLLSTARVYNTFDTLRPAEGQASFAFRSMQAENHWRQVTDAAQVARLLQNDLEQAAFSLIPSLAADKEVIVQEGAIGALMSGSGPTLFGVCESVEGARELEERLTVRGYRCCVASTAEAFAG